MQFEISCPNIYYNAMSKQKHFKQIYVNDTVSEEIYLEIKLRYKERCKCNIKRVFRVFRANYSLLVLE